jgi:hypothetical protein
MREIQFSSFSVGRNMILVMLVLAVSSKASHNIIEDPYSAVPRMPDQSQQPSFVWTNNIRFTIIGWFD